MQRPATDTQRIGVEWVAVDAVQPRADNPRTHSSEQIERLAGAIGELGWTAPLVTDADGVLIAGHGRLLAAKRLGLSDVPVVRRADLDPLEVQALVIADNRIAEDAGWDDEALSKAMAALNAGGVDLSLTGFADDEIANMLAGLDAAATTAQAEEAKAARGAQAAAEAETEDEEAPEPPADPVTQSGDIWILGAHRLLCGDATDPAAAAAALDDIAPALMVTDPPYGVNYDPDWRNRDLGDARRSTGEVLNDGQVAWLAAFEAFTGDVAYVWHAALSCATVLADLEGLGFEARSQIIWRKPQFVISRGHYHWRHEPCWYAVRKNAAAGWRGARDQQTVWDIANVRAGAPGDETVTGHSTQKPVACMRRPIANHDGDVFEPFCGSGSTLIAAEMEGRRCAAIELNPAYVDVALKRWSVFAGRAPIHAETGQTFEERAAAMTRQAA
ncbi:MAG: DNA methyltransferase [Pseudomonadota bacterium]